MKKFIIIFFTFLFPFAIYPKENFEVVLKFGQGGFNDSRSDINKLGGGEMAIDIKLLKSPLTFSYSDAFYTNSPAPTHYYEIKSLHQFSILYKKQFKYNNEYTYFGGGGLLRLKIPDEFNPDQYIYGNGFSFEIGINKIVYKNFGIYGAAKYLYAHKTGEYSIDFNEFILLIGLTYKFLF